jgi:uncharacterized protein
VNDQETFERVCEVMLNPAFYPHPVAALERRDSHISAVFLTGTWVYKLKKPLDFGFLDYRGLETRRRMCELEVKLNQRLCRGVYQGVVAICMDGGDMYFGDSGKVVEYAVKMKQLPDEAALTNLLATRKVGAQDMGRLGKFLGAFYAVSKRSPQIEEYGRSQVIDFNTEENFRQLEPYIGILVSEGPFDFIREASRGFFRDNNRLFENRLEEGRICDGHGDLRTEHVYLVSDAFEIIDCIEFNERFRYGDIAVDLAFLHMDMERLGHSELSLAILSGYIEVSRDYGLYTVLDFYSCYRAIVKMKVTCLTWTELEEGDRKKEMEVRAAQYLDLSFRYAIQCSRPSIYVFCGLPGTGKSTFATRLGELLDLSLFRSDQARRDLPEYSHPGPVPFGTGFYRPDMRARVYSRLLALAQHEVKKGRSVILDATFSLRKWREEAVRLGGDLDANILFFECECAKSTILERMGRRRTDGDSLSDARPEHLPMLVEEFEDIQELPTAFHAKIDTELDLGDNLRNMLSKAYTMRRSQVERAIDRL